MLRGLWGPIWSYNYNGDFLAVGILAVGLFNSGFLGFGNDGFDYESSRNGTGGLFYESDSNGSADVASCSARTGFVDLHIALTAVGSDFQSFDSQDEAMSHRAALSFYALVLGRFPSEQEIPTGGPSCMSLVRESATAAVTELASTSPLASLADRRAFAETVLLGLYNYTPPAGDVESFAVAINDGVPAGIPLAEAVQLRFDNAIAISDMLINDDDYFFDDRLVSNGQLGMAPLCRLSHVGLPAEVVLPPFDLGGATDPAGSDVSLLSVYTLPRNQNAYEPGVAGQGFVVELQNEIETANTAATLRVGFPEGITVTDTSTLTDDTPCVQTGFGPQQIWTCEIDVFAGFYEATFFDLDVGDGFSASDIEFGWSTDGSVPVLSEAFAVGAL